MTLNDYLRLPWTIVRTEHDDDGEYAALEVLELPGFVAAGRTDEELEAAFWDALRSHLSSYLDEGRTPPMPARASIRWERMKRADSVIRYRLPGEAVTVTVGGGDVSEMGLVRA